MLQDKIRNIKIFPLIGLLIILGLVYGGYTLYSKIQFYKSFASKTRVISVVAKEAEVKPINKIYPATSVIEANRSFDVTSKTSGILNDIFFNESSFVKQGDKLFSILSTSSIGEIVISAPFNGFVGITDFKIGDELKNGDVLLTLDDMVTMKAFLYLPEKILPQLKEPIKYTAYSKLFPEEKYTGVITNINQRVDTQTRTIKSYALIDNKNGTLRPGLLLNIDIILEEIPDAILVPEQSILTAKDYSYVFVAEEGISKLKKITSGINNKGMTQILSGINEGDLVVTLGQEKLKDGSKIKLISE